MTNRSFLNGNANNGEKNPLNSSSPFIIQIVNAAGSPAVANVDIGDSLKNRTASNFGQDSHITITSNVAGTSYLDFLSQSESRPFMVGATMIISTSSGQLDQTVAITHRNASGDRMDHVLTPTLTINQKQTDRIADGYEYLFDGFTRLRINQVNANAEIQLRIYPKFIYSSTQIVAGRNSMREFGEPRIY